MKKNIITFIAGIIITAVLTGCSYGSSMLIGSVENNSSSKISASYYKFDGQKSKSIKVKDGEVVDVKVDISTKSGSIGLSIADENGRSFYQGNDIPTSSFIVTLDKKGDYKMTLDAKKHKGSYKISWGKQEQK